MPSYLQTFLVLSAATVTVLAAPTRSATCPAHDDAGGALINAITEKNGQFLDCRYQKAGLCTYFITEGSFSSGSSICPDSAIAASGGSASGSATCGLTDDAGSTLQGSSVGTDGFVSCKYQAAGTCKYFSPGGQFSAGASTCPDSITPDKGSSSSAFGSKTGVKTNSNAVSAGSASSPVHFRPRALCRQR
ncbi:hypothetical protein B0H17DRAFT_435405 [Mycena rosella]|uniref:Uncharacterized protein n=1 Tax=Mycena rosella TaxID=1033263 RepID=A0AAD7G0X0_MYCRO|nr:hypothetical protein B0H17DRAFT_435405 [Mycena rosella]